MNTKTQPPAAGEAAHTPTPWRLNDEREAGTSRCIYGPQGELITSPNVGQFRSLETARANAAFIVRACNSHAALVAALEQTRADLAKFAKDANYPNTVGPWLARIDAALSAARA